MRNTRTFLAAGLALCLLAPSLAQAAGGLASSTCSTSVDIDQGFWLAHVTCDVFSDDPNVPENPLPVPGRFTYVYTVTNDAGSTLDLQGFKVPFVEGAVVDPGQVSFEDGSGIEPSQMLITSEQEVQFLFESPALIQPGQTSERLIIVSEYSVGAADVIVSGTFGAGSGECLGPENLPPPPGSIPRSSTQDTFLRGGVTNRNEGANVFVRLQATGKNHPLIGFDLSDLPSRPLRSATLALTIHPSNTPSSWGKNMDRTVDVHRITVPWEQGNGRGADTPRALRTRGSGAGATWKCPVDSNIDNQKTDCPAVWNGGTYAPATAPGVVHYNGISGEVTWDVTQDLRDALAGADFHGFLVRKTKEGKSGNVRYYSTEGAAEASDPSLAPRLILEFD